MYELQRLKKIRHKDIYCEGLLSKVFSSCTKCDLLWIYCAKYIGVKYLQKDFFGNYEGKLLVKGDLVRDILQN